jgi:hypothetical protein
MALSNEERDRIREEEWVRLQARADFYKTNPSAGANWGQGQGQGWGPNSGTGWGRYRRPWFPVTLVIIFAFVLLNNLIRFIRLDHIWP